MTLTSTGARRPPGAEFGDETTKLRRARFSSNDPIPVWAMGLKRRELRFFEP